MFKWTAYPFVRITIVWIIGILSAVFFQADQAVFSFLCLTCLIISFILYFVVGGKYSHQGRIALGFFLLASLFCGGAWRYLQYDQLRDPAHIAHSPDSGFFYFGRVDEEIERAGNFNKTIVETQGRKTGQGWAPASGKVLIYADTTAGLRYGDCILIKGAPEALSPPANPGEFDYKSYLKYQNVHVRHFIFRPEAISILNRNDNSSLREYFIAFRMRAKSLIKVHINGENEQAVAQALLLGMKNDLDNELKTAYGAAGAMHVLAVSGLHVGIIYGFLYFLLKGMRRRKYGRVAFAAVNLLILWAYAAVTGFAPSTIRAVIMFSVIIVGQVFNARSNIYNSIFLSAFIILLWNPYMLMAVGFQLSYLAVLGIVYLAPKFYHAVVFKSALLDKAWMLTSVSLAAQIATFPVTVYYFNQFPAYFWASNIVVVPGAFLILALGLPFLALGFWNTAASVFGFLLDVVISGMNAVVLLVEKLPGSLFYPLAISEFQVILLYAGIVFILVLFYARKFRYGLLAFCCLFLFSLIVMSERRQQSQQRKVVFYSIHGATAVDFIKGREAVLYADNVINEDEDKFQYHIAPCRIGMGLTPYREENKTFALFEGEGTGLQRLTCRGVRIVFINKPLNNRQPSTKVDADIIVALDNAIDGLAHLNEMFKYDQLVIGSAYYPSVAEKLMAEAKESGVSCHALGREGAKIVEL